MFIDYPQSLTNVDISAQGNLKLVSEKSGSLLSIICRNPELNTQSPYKTVLLQFSFNHNRLATVSCGTAGVCDCHRSCHEYSVVSNVIFRLTRHPLFRESS